MDSGCDAGDWREWIRSRNVPHRLRAGRGQEHRLRKVEHCRVAPGSDGEWCITQHAADLASGLVGVSRAHLHCVPGPAAHHDAAPHLYVATQHVSA